jgi:hypothetical protein
MLFGSASLQDSTAFLAAKLGVAIELWDLPPPETGSRHRGPAKPRRDPAVSSGDGAWLRPHEEQTFLDQRRQLLMGAAAGGRVDVLATLLDKPAPHDRLRKDELDAALAACREAQPSNQRTVSFRAR